MQELSLTRRFRCRLWYAHRLKKDTILPSGKIMVDSVIPHKSNKTNGFTFFEHHLNDKCAFHSQNHCSSHGNGGVEPRWAPKCSSHTPISLSYICHYYLDVELDTGLSWSKTFETKTNSSLSKSPSYRLNFRPSRVVSINCCWTRN